MKKHPYYVESAHHIKALFLTGFLIAFLGWLWETLYAALILQSPNDRGFLILPICPIYGISVIAVYLLLRTPKDMRLLGKEIFKKQPVRRYISYYILSGLFATFLELLTGLLFDIVFHVRLWNYKDHFWNISGYVALLPSLGWGIAITVFMRLVFYPLFHAIKRYREYSLAVLFHLFLILIMADSIFNFSYLLLNGKWYNFNSLFQ